MANVPTALRVVREHQLGRQHELLSLRCAGARHRAASRGRRAVRGRRLLRAFDRVRNDRERRAEPRPRDRAAQRPHRRALLDGRRVERHPRRVIAPHARIVPAQDRVAHAGGRQAVGRCPRGAHEFLNLV
eukprot:5752738-Prymnesium_polylepis.3